jgi:hypothetical protein
MHAFCVAQIVNDPVLLLLRQIIKINYKNFNSLMLALQ